MKKMEEAQVEQWKDMEKYRWKVSWRVKTYGQYGRKVSWKVKKYEKYGRKLRWKVK
jgi:hypothetical protein